MTDTYCELTQEQLDSIRALAYEKYVARGGEDGHDLEDWLAAEQEVSSCCSGNGNGNGAEEQEPVRRTRGTKSTKSESRSTASSGTKS